MHSPKRPERPQRPDHFLKEAIGQMLAVHTPSLAPLVPRIALAATHDVTVLLTGETGVGKTFLARLLHDYSQRRDHPFLVVPCGALAVSLIESELFGHAKGAFTGAVRTKTGKFAAAGEGTLLLDEIDTLEPEQQAKLLHVLETGEYEPVGSTRVHLSHARVIAASNCDLLEAIRRRRFREDLYYRLNLMTFHLPPLRERKPDIGPLVQLMIQRFRAKFCKGDLRLHPETLAALEEYPWPGNIRELENVMQRAVLLCQGPEILMSHLPAPMFHRAARP